MSIASVPSSSFRKQQFHGFQREREQHCEQQQQQQQQQYTQQGQLLESVNRHKERVLNASLRVEVLECQIREEVEKLISLIGSSSSCSSSHSIVSISSSHQMIDKDDYNTGSSSSSCCSHSILSNCSSHRTINRDDHNNNNPHIHQLEANILQLENDLLTEQRTLAEYEKLYQVSLERTKQQWKQQIEEHQRRFRVCYRAVPHHTRSESL